MIAGKITSFLLHRLLVICFLCMNSHNPNQKKKISAAYEHAWCSRHKKALKLTNKQKVIHLGNCSKHTKRHSECNWNCICNFSFKGLTALEIKAHMESDHLKANEGGDDDEDDEDDTRMYDDAYMFDDEEDEDEEDEDDKVEYDESGYNNEYDDHDKVEYNSSTDHRPNYSGGDDEFVSNDEVISGLFDKEMSLQMNYLKHHK
eukprot:963588_1